MIAITSISPSHRNFDSQLRAIESWQKAGYEVVSLNAEEEIEKLKAFKGVKFISTSRHNKVIFGRPYVIVSAIIDYLKEIKSEYSLIINSDIIINDPLNITPKLKEWSEDGVVVMNRGDFEGDINTYKIYEDGFDGFFINGKHLEIFPQTILCLGQCHWDFWVPYVATQAGVKIKKLNEPYIFHAKHPVQYSRENWIRTGEIARAEIGMLGIRNIGQVSSMMMRNIKIGFNK